MRHENKYNGKIMRCLNKDLGIANEGIHYVYVKKNKNKSKSNFNVHTITSLESSSISKEYCIPLLIDEKKNKYVFLNANKLRHIRNGFIYPIPLNQSNFKLWSGVSHNEIENIPRNRLRKTKKQIWNQHKFFGGKILK